MKNMWNNSMTSLPTPKSINMLWNMGFMLGMILTLQIITGLMLSMNYVASTEMAFHSMIHIMRDIETGWVMRFSHMNGASLFFLLMFIHIARGIYFYSPKKIPMVWTSGVTILLLSMMAAFMGYVLPWGQMSYWGATVITSMLSSVPYIGDSLIMWLWGDFSVSQPTLNRMLSLHFLVPLVIMAAAMAHLMILHFSGSSNPSGTITNYDKMKFFPYFMVKDMTPLITTTLALSTILSLSPDMLGDPENFNTASSTSTPTHIKPEWYFLFAYAILRCIPSKLGGVIMMVTAILVLMVMIMEKKSKTSKFNPFKKVLFWLYMSTMTLLTWMGGKAVNDLTMAIAQFMTMLYFSLSMML